MNEYGRSTSVFRAARKVISDPSLAIPLLHSAFSQRIIGPIRSSRRPGALAIFHIGRCGSTVLTELLDQHPEIYWDGETYVRVLKELSLDGTAREISGFNPAQYIDQRLSRSGARWFGFDLKFYHVTDFGVSLNDYVEAIRASGVSHIIVLRRRNYLRKVVSGRLGYERGWYHTKAAVKSNQTQVRIDADRVSVDGTMASLIQHFERWDQEYAAIRNATEAGRILELEYESDIQNGPLGAYDKVLKFLDLQQHSAVVTLKRVNPQPLHELISNYREIVERLSGTKYEWMLELDE